MSKRFSIYQVDAFADAVFSGNPAAVVPLEQWLPDEVLQKIAAENNLSETAYFVKAGQPHHYELRWFTPNFEIDLCGHATLATAFVIKTFVDQDASELIFHTQKAGELKVGIDGEWLTLDFPARMPEPYTNLPLIARALGVEAVEEVMLSRDLFVVLADEDTVKALNPNMGQLEKLEGMGVTVTAPGKNTDVYSRFFAPKAGIPEDPVTGSAHCNIVPYWCQKLGKQAISCLQGGPRQGLLQCSLKGDRVTMAGKAVLYLKGEIFIDN